MRILVFLLLAVASCSALDILDKVLGALQASDTEPVLPQIAFQASLFEPVEVIEPPGTPIIYDQVQVNTENFYNTETGFFVAPVTGLYWFGFHHTSPNTTAVVRMQVNGETWSSCGVGFGTCATNAVFLLRAGDAVGNMLDYERQGSLDCNIYHNCQFSGFKLTRQSLQDLAEWRQG